jgi:hypothetical protein
MATTKRFRAMLETEDGNTFTFIVIPFDVKQAFGRARPPVKATINGFTYRSTPAPYGGVHYLPVSQTVRDGAKVKAGDRVNVTLQLDAEPRVVKVPPDFARALRMNPIAKTKWNKLSTRIARNTLTRSRKRRSRRRALAAFRKRSSS